MSGCNGSRATQATSMASWEVNRRCGSDPPSIMCVGKGRQRKKLLIYIVDNPVRPGLVERWQDWPWTKVFIEI